VSDVWRVLPVVAVILFSLGNQALACPICFTGRAVSIGQRLDAADAAVLAQPVSPEGSYKVLEVVKGDASSLAPIITDVMPPAAAPAATSGSAQLLLRNRLSGGWTSLGIIPARHAEWLRQLAAMEPSGEPVVRLAKPHRAVHPDEGWLKRLRLVAPHLESSDPLAAEIAYGEVARAPYQDLRPLKSELDPEAIAGWLADPALAARRPAYTLLLGITATPTASAIVEKSLAAAYQLHDASNLSALLAADLELHGATRLSWIEQRYFADRKRTLPEIEAALLALSVQGSADAAVPRGEIIASYMRFIDLRRSMAGFVVGDLITWKFWGATGKLVELLRSDALKDPASRLAVINYLRQSPIPIASAEIEQLSDLPP
jgi:hypothetical protein